MKKRSILIGSVMGLVLTATGVSAMVAGLSDVPEDHWAADAIAYLKNANVLTGYGDGTFRPNNNITRAEAAVVVYKNNQEWVKKFNAMEAKLEAMQKMVDELSIDDNATYFTASLDGDQEVPAVDTFAVGTANFELKGNTLSYEISVYDLTGEVTAAHFHAGDVGQSGDPVHTIEFDGTTAAGTWTMTDEELKNLSDEMYYVNVHTASNPGGEIRGQVLLK